MVGTVLPDFRKFLSERKLVLQNQIPFYAPWVGKFLAFSNKHKNLNRNELFRTFLNYLKGQRRIADKQVKQADAPKSLLNMFYTNERKGN